MTWQEACRILELTIPNTLEEVREAFSIQVKAWHPDRFEGDSKMQRIGTSKMKLINEAFGYIKEHWEERGLPNQPYEFPGTAEFPVTRKLGPRDIVTVVENSNVNAKKNGIVVGARRVHEYLGDAIITVTRPDHRSRELKLKVGQASVVEFGRAERFEVRLLQVRQVFKSKRGLPFPLFYSAADVSITKLR